MGSPRHRKGVILLQWSQLDFARCLHTYISSHMAVFGAPALCTLSEVTSLLLDAWPGLANYSCALGWGWVSASLWQGSGQRVGCPGSCCQASCHSLRWLRWKCLPSPGPGALWSRWSSLLVTTSSGFLPFLGHLSLFCPFCFPSWTSSLPHAHPPVPSDPTVQTSGYFLRAFCSLRLFLLTSTYLLLSPIL